MNYILEIKSLKKKEKEKVFNISDKRLLNNLSNSGGLLSFYFFIFFLLLLNGLLMQEFLHSLWCLLFSPFFSLFYDQREMLLFLRERK